jgi:hypothetical protein
MSKINNFSDSAIMDGMAILNLLDTEYLDEFDYSNSSNISTYSPEEIDPKKPADLDSRYNYISMLEVMFPE